MSRIGVKPIPLPAGVTLQVDGQDVRVKGPKGELHWRVPPGVSVVVEGARARVLRGGGESDENDGRLKALHGTTRSLLSNMVRGVANGYRKELEIQGVGFKAQKQGGQVIFNLGYSHPIVLEPPPGVLIEVSEGTQIVVSGIDKQAVGEVSARIRGFYKAEPYKGKGVRYKGEHVRRKAGKTVA
jgi:large subunit ribosomal protein L6